MDFIIGTFLRLIILFVCIIIEIGATLKMVSYKSISTKNVVLILLPLVILFAMFFQGNYKIPRIDLKALISVAQDVSDDKVYEGIYNFNQYSVILSCYNVEETFNELDEISDSCNGLEKLISKKGYLDGIEYFLTPMTSDRQSEGFYMHQGYKGTIFIAVSKNTIVEINYSIYREIDKMLGWLFSPPINRKIDFSQVISSNNLVQQWKE